MLARGSDVPAETFPRERLRRAACRLSCGNCRSLLVVFEHTIEGGCMSERPLSELAREIIEGAVRLSAATARWLVKVGEFDERGGWGRGGGGGAGRASSRARTGCPGSRGWPPGRRGRTCGWRGQCSGCR